MYIMLRTKALVVFLFLLHSHILSAQFSIIQDKDGYVNVRADDNKDAKVVDTLSNGHLVMDNGVNDERKNWIAVNYHKNGREYSGFIHASRLQPIPNIEGIRELKLKSATAFTSVYQSDSIKVSIAIKNFVPKEHQLELDKESGHWVVKIDGADYWGTDGAMPKTAYKQIAIQWGSSTFELPAKALKNILQPDDGSAEVYVDFKNKRVYITTSNGDGAGGYDVMWVWENGWYKDRLVWQP